MASGNVYVAKRIRGPSPGGGPSGQVLDGIAGYEVYSAIFLDKGVLWQLYQKKLWVTTINRKDRMRDSYYNCQYSRHRGEHGGGFRGVIVVCVFISLTAIFVVL